MEVVTPSVMCCVVGVGVVTKDVVGGVTVSVVEGLGEVSVVELARVEVYTGVVISVVSVVKVPVGTVGVDEA